MRGREARLDASTHRSPTTIPTLGLRCSARSALGRRARRPLGCARRRAGSAAATCAQLQPSILPMLLVVVVDAGLALVKVSVGVVRVRVHEIGVGWRRGISTARRAARWRRGPTPNDRSAINSAGAQGRAAAQHLL